jgi:hypothetical protein
MLLVGSVLLGRHVVALPKPPVDPITTRAFAARRRVIGAERIARMLVGFQKKGAGITTHRLTTLNGEPVIATFVGEKLYLVTAFATDGERILHIYRIVNPDKLAATGFPVLGPVPRRERHR